MVTERTNLINIREILSRCLRHPMLKSLDLEQAVQYVNDFVGIVGMPTFYEDKLELIPIEEYRGLLPCDLVSIKQVKDTSTGQCLRSIEDNFTPGLRHKPQLPGKVIDMAKIQDVYPQPLGMDRCPVLSSPRNDGELAFKTQGRIIFTSFRTGMIELSYKALPVDNEGLPLLIDNANFLKALELYIKKLVFTIYYDMGKLQAGILLNVQQEYAFAVAQCEKEFITPSVSEIESICRMWTSLLLKNHRFDNGFKELGNRQYLNIK